MRTSAPLLLFLLSSSDFDVFDAARWRRKRTPVLTQACQMKLYRSADCSFGCFDRRPGCHATRKIRNVGGVVAPGVLNDDRITHGKTCFFRPACLRILLSVPGAKSSLASRRPSRDRASSDASTDGDCPWSQPSTTHRAQAFAGFPIPSRSVPPPLFATKVRKENPLATASSPACALRAPDSRRGERGRRPLRSGRSRLETGLPALPVVRR